MSPAGVARMRCGDQKKENDASFVSHRRIVESRGAGTTERKSMRS